MSVHPPPFCFSYGNTLNVISVIVLKSSNIFFCGERETKNDFFFTILTRFHFIYPIIEFQKFRSIDENRLDLIATTEWMSLSNPEKDFLKQKK